MVQTAVASPDAEETLSQRAKVTEKTLEAIRTATTSLGFDRQAIAKHFDLSYTHLDNIITRHLDAWWRESKKAWEASQGPDSKPSKRFADIIQPVRPFAVPILPPVKAEKKRWYTAVIYGDSHVPFQDPQAERVVLGIIKDAQPDFVCHVGDLGDCYKISRYSTDPTRQQSMQDDIDAMRIHIHQVSQAAPKAQKLLLGGNHEDRLRKLIWNLEGAARELPRLRVFQRAMTWPVLLGLDEIGWDFVEYLKQPVVGRIPRLLLKHGTVVRKWSAFSAKGEWEKHARPGVSGHTHRLGAFFHRDLNGSHVWYESGCTCSLDPEYACQPDWQHGCLVVTYNEEWFHGSLVYIQDGRAVWRTKEYVA